MRLSTPYGRPRRSPLRALAVLTAACLGACALVLPAATTSQAVTTPPLTVPALQQWTAGSGGFVLKQGARVAIDPAYASTLTADAQLLSGELRQMTGTAVTVTALVPSEAATGDIVLTLGATDSRLGGEGYTLTSGSTLVVQARTGTGAFYGTRTALQLLHQNRTIPGGTARDWSVKPERGLMVDVGRKYYTVTWLQQEIREMAYLKLDYFHLHLSDDQGFRIESSTHPEIVSAQHYTKQQIADLIAYAGRYHVTVVPEIDAPGHMTPILAAHPELQLKNSSGTPSPGNIDLSKQAAYTLIDDLIKEYLPLFPAPYWHTGADEYLTSYTAYPQLLTYAKAHYGGNAKAVDTYYGFVNHVDSLVRAAGKTTRMWSDGVKGDGTIAPATDIVMEKWNTSGLSPQALVNSGYSVTDEPRSWLYYVLGGYKPPTAALYESWTADTFDTGTTLTDVSKNRGSELHVWGDSPTAETEQQVADGIEKPLRVLAQQTWGSPESTSTYSGFVPVMGAIGHATGFPGAATAGDIAQYRPVTTSSVEPVKAANGTTSNTDYLGGTNVTDDASTTRWSSLRTDPQWLTIDLGSSRSVTRVRLTWEAAYGKAYQVQTSDDRSTWSTIYSTTTGTGGTEDRTGLKGHGRYLRLALTQRGTAYGYSLYNVEVFG